MFNMLIVWYYFQDFEIQYWISTSWDWLKRKVSFIYIILQVL